MIRLASLIVAGSLLLFSCSEKSSLVNLTTNASTDTTYLTTPEAVGSRRVLIEEFTGVKCPNCPTGHQRLAAFQAQYPGRVSVVGYQIFGIDQAKPLEGETRSDNRSQKATELGSLIFGGVPALPVASFDRTPKNGAMLMTQNLWANALDGRLGIASPVNLTVTPSYSESNRQVTVKVRVAYTGDVTTKQRLTLALTEGAIVDAQESTDTVYGEYDHEHVFRDFLTATDGDPMLDGFAAKNAGRVYERTFVFVLNQAWKPENCAMVAFVHTVDGDQKEVYQVTEAKLR